MLGVFPDLFPDELLYGVFARYADIMRFKSLKEVHSQLFGSYNLRSVVDLPTHINTFIDHLPVGHQYTAETIIEKHTLLPYYIAFLSTERIRKMTEYMLGDRGEAVYLLSGISTYSVSKPSYLKYCQICIQEDKLKYGSAYWHRVHQLPGVEVCPQHRVFLENSDIQTSNRQTLHAYHCVPTSNVKSAIPANLKQKEDRQLIRIAEDSQWLLQNPAKFREMRELHTELRNLLNAKGWLSANGKKVYISELRSEFVWQFTPSLLDRLQCYLDENSCHTWLERLVRKPRVSQHPLHYILLLYFLGESVSSFLGTKEISVNEDNQNILFAPCLNKASDHFGEMLIKVSINPRTAEKGRQIFICPLCSYSYVKSNMPSGKRVVDFGWAWKEKLRIVASDPTVSLRKIASEMGTDVKTIKKYINNLGLSGNREIANIAEKRLESDMIEDKRQKYRDLWSYNCEQYPEDGSTALRKRLPAAYAWLYQNDRSWLNEHKPNYKKPLPKPRVDWMERDLCIRNQAEVVIQSLMANKEKPVRITVTTVARQLGLLARIEHNRDKLPLTWEYLQSVSESRKDYARRRIMYIIEKYRREGIVPPLWQIERQAGIRKDMREEVSEILEAEYMSLNKF